MLRSAGITVAVATLLSGCDRSSTPQVDGPKPPHFDAVQASKVRDTAQSIAGPDATVLLICGESVGFSYYADEIGWVEDKVSGQFAVTRDPDGAHDVIFSSGAYGFISARADGGEVDHLSSSGSADFVVTIRYPNSGIVESHVFRFDPNGPGVALSSTVKPAQALIPTRARTLVSNCYRLD